MSRLSGDKIRAIGMMSGTSLDGMDLVAAEFWDSDKKWNFRIVNACTIPYTDEWNTNLHKAHQLDGKKLISLHSEYGDFIGKEIGKFCEENSFHPDLIASHGHTIFHQPELGFTFQLGHGANIASATRFTTVSDFRTGDVALGGQGAPLVPIGDALLFEDFDYCLNLGGFANISFDADGRKAFDICPVNFVLNHLSARLGKSFDDKGALGRSGILVPSLLENLNELPFYKQNAPKSLGREWVEKWFLPQIARPHIPEQDILRTVYEHIGMQIGASIEKKKRVLVTGGGAYNTFLMERIDHHSQARIEIPTPEIIDYKEALIFAFLGVLRLRGQNNCLASVTGARRDNQGGVVYPAN